MNVPVGSLRCSLKGTLWPIFGKVKKRCIYVIIIHNWRWINSRESSKIQIWHTSWVSFWWVVNLGNTQWKDPRSEQRRNFGTVPEETHQNRLTGTSPTFMWVTCESQVFVYVFVFLFLIINKTRGREVFVFIIRGKVRTKVNTYRRVSVWWETKH